MSIVKRFWGLVSAPSREWQRIAEEEFNTATALVFMALFLSFYAVAVVLYAYTAGSGERVLNIAFGVFQIAVFAATLFLSAAFISPIAGKLDGRASYRSSLCYLAYGSTGLMLGALFRTVPVAGRALCGGGLVYSAYLLNAGAPAMFGMDKPNATVFALLTLVILSGTAVLLGGGLLLLLSVLMLYATFG